LERLRSERTQLQNRFIRILLIQSSDITTKLIEYQWSNQMAQQPSVKEHGHDIVPSNLIPLVKGHDYENQSVYSHLIRSVKEHDHGNIPSNLFVQPLDTTMKPLHHHDNKIALSQSGLYNQPTQL
jgi:hypothetical protein